MMRMLRYVINLYRYLIASRLAGYKLRKLARGCGNDVELLVKLVFSFSHQYLMGLPSASRSITIKPIQVFEVILELARIVKKLKPRYILEIGTANGGTLFLWCRLAMDDATVISVDLPGGPFGGGYPKWRIPLYKSFAKEKQRLYLIRASSHDPRTLKNVRRILGENKLDFLFIDGDHTYEGVKKDFEMYVPLVRKGGIVTFHDIVPGPLELVGGVPKFWNEIKRETKYKNVEVVQDWSQGGYGLGILFI